MVKFRDQAKGNDKWKKEREAMILAVRGVMENREAARERERERGGGREREGEERERAEQSEAKEKEKDTDKWAER